MTRAELVTHLIAEHGVTFHEGALDYSDEMLVELHEEIHEPGTHYMTMLWNPETKCWE